MNAVKASGLVLLLLGVAGYSGVFGQHEKYRSKLHEAEAAIKTTQNESERQLAQSTYNIYDKKMGKTGYKTFGPLLLAYVGASLYRKEENIVR